MAIAEIPILSSDLEQIYTALDNLHTFSVLADLNRGLQNLQTKHVPSKLTAQADDAKTKVALYLAQSQTQEEEKNDGIPEQ